MNFKTIKKGICLLLAGSIAVSLAACAPETADVSEIFDEENKISYCTTYKKLSETKENKTDSWRQGMVSGNGRQGVITSGAPYSDTLIYQNIHFIMPNQNARTCPVTSDELETVKQHIINGEDIVDNSSYDDVYYYHPGGELRITQETQRESDYVRYTDYETAETGVRYTDKNGTWARSTFTSRADDVTITKISASDTGTKVDLTLSFDDISVMANYNDGNKKDMQYKKIVADDCEYIAFVAHYPNYENSELKNGGYATLTYVITQGGTKEKISGKAVDDEQYAAEDNPQIQITDADQVYLITVSDRTYEMGALADFAAAQEYALVNELADDCKAVSQKYSQSGAFDYDAALNAHTALHQPQFDAVTFTLNGGSSNASNETLLKNARGEDDISSALAQRAFYSGRYAYLCCAGTSTSRLYGMWTGEWNTSWGSKYTMDANVNLQISSMNTGNISSAPVGYVYFLLRQMPDWEENALATHGYTDAIQAPVNTDGDKAVITETAYPYPFRYWNAGTAWMLYPLYEALQCYGDMQIPLSDEFDLEALKSVLSVTEDDLTDEDIQAIRERGYLDLRTEILLPLLTKAANYWDQMLSPDYYTDADGNIHYESGKTELAENEYYCILPSYSPENNPVNYKSPSTANCAIDISACNSNLEMLINIMKSTDPNADTGKWEALKQKLPPYLYDETGALKEWACNQFEENNEHRHLSHLYCAWPMTETQNNEELRKACMQAVENRASENEASHALVHRSLIAARLKDRGALTQALTDLMNSKIYYNSLMTNHDFDRGSCYCTDFAIGYLGILSESLAFSDTGVIEILPCLPNSGFDAGEITGIRARTRALINDLKWDTAAGTASVTVTSDIAQTIEISCGLSGETQSIAFAADETKTIEFTF